MTLADIVRDLTDDALLKSLEYHSDKVLNSETRETHAYWNERLLTVEAEAWERMSRVYPDVDKTANI